MVLTFYGFNAHDVDIYNISAHAQFWHLCQLLIAYVLCIHNQGTDIQCRSHLDATINSCVSKLHQEHLVGPGRMHPKKATPSQVLRRP